MGKKYRNCELNEDGSISCVAYRPTKGGEKIPTATIQAQPTPDCKMAIIREDGDPKDLEDLHEYLGRVAKVKCKNKL